MILEILGSRILAPFVGVSIIVWTSLIGIILGSLSLGYYLGGKIIDKKPNEELLSLVVFTASILIAAIPICRTPLFIILQNSFKSLILNSIIATIVLFSLPTISLGMVTPIALKLRLLSIKNSGQVSGNLYAISTLGSIFGTFFAGFYLIATFSIDQILLGMSVLLFILSIFLRFGKFRRKRLLIFILFTTLAVLSSKILVSKNVLLFNSHYNSIRILNTFDQTNNEPTRYLNLDNKMDSAMYVNSNALVFDYTKAYRLAEVFEPNLKRVLIIGGGGYSVPKDFLRRYASTHVDVVEIDPRLTELSEKYFNLKRDPRLTIYHEDGRTFINRVSKDRDSTYDAILLDAYKSYAVPFHLTTVETVQMLHEMLSENGVVMANIISSLEGDTSRFLHAEIRTYQSIFPYTYVIPVNYPKQKFTVQNTMFIASKKPLIDRSTNDAELSGFLHSMGTKEVGEDVPILTDQFAPVDQYTIPIVVN